MNEKAYTHMMAWAIQHIFSTHKEAMEIIADETLSESDKMLKLKGTNGTDHRIVNLMVLLKPALTDAKQAYPHLDKFFEWYDDKYAFIEENKMVEGICGCKGCADEVIEPAQEPEPAS